MPHVQLMHKRILSQKTFHGNELEQFNISINTKKMPSGIFLSGNLKIPRRPIFECTNLMYRNRDKFKKTNLAGDHEFEFVNSQTFSHISQMFCVISLSKVIYKILEQRG